MMQYCYNCQSHQNFVDVDKKGSSAKLHCSTCGIYDWFNEQELKHRQRRKQLKESYTVAGTIELPISIDLQATDTTEALAQAQTILDELGIKEINLSVTTMDNKQIELNVHDHFIEINQALVVSKDL